MFFVVIIIAGRILSSQESSSPAAPSSSTDARSGIVSGKQAEVVRVTAHELFQQYDENEVATDSRLKGKIVEVTGRVQAINKNVWDNVYVTLVTPNQFMSASMHVLKSEEQKIAAATDNTMKFMIKGVVHRQSSEAAP